MIVLFMSGLVLLPVSAHHKGYRGSLLAIGSALMLGLSSLYGLFSALAFSVSI